MKKEHDEEWIKWIRSEYPSPELTSQELSQIQQRAEERRFQKVRPPMSSFVWAFASVFVAMIAFASLMQFEDYQEREKLAAHADVVWAIEMLEQPTIDEDETDYLPEAFQAIAQLNITLDFQDLDRR